MKGGPSQCFSQGGRILDASDFLPSFTIPKLHTIKKQKYHIRTSEHTT